MSGQVDTFACRTARMLDLASGVGTGTPVRPSRVRNRSKTETGEKIKKPAEESRKKPPSTRKAPARGRYVDEYAQPTA
ncbi:MAG: hypothetical protein IV085_01850 [Thiobacillus sp.]|nr:hypothetical protein [Thiobacillus sp.]